MSDVKTNKYKSATSTSDCDTAILALLDSMVVTPDSNLIGILQAVQEQFGYIPSPAFSQISRRTQIPLSRIYGVATFYSHFALEPKGKYIIRLCNGTACHVKKSISILDALYTKLGLSDSSRTTPDMLFTVETVSCLGACGLAPVVVINEDVHGQVTPEMTVKLIEEIQTSEEAGR